MKKFGICLFVILMASVVCATWEPVNRIESKDSLNATYSYTNNAVGAQRIMSILSKYVSAASGTQTISITPKNGKEVLIKSSTISSVTNHVIGALEFSGFYLYTGDILTIDNDTGVTNDLSIVLDGHR